MNGPTHAHHSHEVTPLELFFDLVFVFAVSQLTHHLLENLHWRGLVETVVLLIGVFGVWSYTSFEATVIEQRRTHVTRMLLLVMMGGLFMNAAISHAFDQGAFAFVMPMLAIQLCRTLLVTLPAAPTSLLRQHYLRLIGWILSRLRYGYSAP
jgi:low temperature requirement protein LtrA